MHTLIVLAAVAAATVPQEPTYPPAGPATFDVAGVHLGLNVSATRAALTRAGYRILRTDLDTSFEQKAAFQAERLKGTAFPKIATATMPVRIVATGASGESLTIDFAQWPAGPRVSGLVLAVSPDRRSSADFRAQVEARYGRPSYSMDRADFTWCSPDDGQCGRMSVAMLPTLTASYSSLNLLTVRSGPADERQLDQAMRSEVERLAPSLRRSAF